MGLQYRFVWIYRLLIPIIHRKAVKNSFKEAVGKNVSVFEVACGFGQTADYLDGTTSYDGVDLNKKFVNYGRKRGKDIRLGDIFESESYVTSDVITLVDVIHHMPEGKLTDLFNNVFKFAKKKVVILEPAFVNLQSKYGIFGKFADWVLKKLDSDGFNTIQRWYSEAEYAELYNSRFGSKYAKDYSLETKKVWPYNLVTYTRKQDNAM